MSLVTSSARSTGTIAPPGSPPAKRYLLASPPRSASANVNVPSGVKTLLSQKRRDPRTRGPTSSSCAVVSPAAYQPVVRPGRLRYVPDNSAAPISPAVVSLPIEIDATNAGEVLTLVTAAFAPGRHGRHRQPGRNPLLRFRWPAAAAPGPPRGRSGRRAAEARHPPGRSGEPGLRTDRHQPFRRRLSDAAARRRRP